MRMRTALALAGAAITAAAGTATAVPALASDATAGVRSPGVHTLTFTGYPTSYHFYNKKQTLGIEIDKDLHHGTFIGSDLVDFLASGKSDVAFALRNGFLYAVFTVAKSGAISGRITSGTGSYRGATGTMTGMAKPKSAYVVLTYHRRRDSSG